MRSRPAVVALLVIGAAATPLPAQEVSLERILVPIYVSEPLPGAFGASWVTDLWVGNPSPELAVVNGLVWSCILPECIGAPTPIEPGVTMFTGLQYIDSDRGAFLRAASADAERLAFGLRFRDLSRQAETWGTELPVVPEEGFRSGRFSLVDVPVTEGFRQTLRVYELEGVEREALVRIRIFRLDSGHREPYDPPDVLLGEGTVALTFIPPLFSDPVHPGYAMISDLSAIAPLGDAERLRIEIEPETPGLRLWAFVTIVHNETQHATVVTPQ